MAVVNEPNSALKKSKVSIIEEGDSDNDQEMADEATSSSEDDDGDIDDGVCPESSEEDADDEDDGAPDSEAKSGWADAMAKILGGNKEVKNPVLARAKLDKDIKGLKKKKKSDSKAANSGDSGSSDDDEQPLKRDSFAVRKAKKKEMEELGRTRPNIINDRQRERRLVKLATKGIVQLFNAVRDQQSTLKKDLKQAGGSIRKREKVFNSIDKDLFFEVLAGDKQKK